MITRERARELRAVIEGAVSTYDMEDSEALKVVELFPIWETLLAAGNALEDFDPDKWPGAENTYWKSLLRTMPTDKLEAFYRARLGEPKF